jgi:predicted KAP-like P-loop ATPase
MYSERPIKSKKEDEFGIAHLADKICEIITIEPKNSSYILGINGRIGIGKTSLMNLIKEKIKEKKEFKIISFNPWYYKDLESLINGFIQQVKEKPFVEFLKTILNAISINSITNSINIGPVKFEFKLSLREIKKKQSIEEATKKFKKWLGSKKIFS